MRVMKTRVRQIYVEDLPVWNSGWLPCRRDRRFGQVFHVLQVVRSNSWQNILPLEYSNYLSCIIRVWWPISIGCY